MSLYKFKRNIIVSNNKGLKSIIKTHNLNQFNIILLRFFKINEAKKKVSLFSIKTDYNSFIRNFFKDKNFSLNILRDLHKKAVKNYNIFLNNFKILATKTFSN